MSPRPENVVAAEKAAAEKAAAVAAMAAALTRNDAIKIMSEVKNRSEEEFPVSATPATPATLAIVVSRGKLEIAKRGPWYFLTGMKPWRLHKRNLNKQGLSNEGYIINIEGLPEDFIPSDEGQNGGQLITLQSGEINKAMKGMTGWKDIGKWSRKQERNIQHRLNETVNKSTIGDVLLKLLSVKSPFPRKLLSVNPPAPVPTYLPINYRNREGDGDYFARYFHDGLTAKDVHPTLTTLGLELRKYCEHKKPINKPIKKRR
jgi:hypothetical protein